jgi:LuxR family maltose regulon positive regulatory protein
MRFSARLPATAARSDRVEGFTWRERRIIELVKRRLSNKEISAILGVSEGTVKFHLSNIFAKLGVRDRHHMIEVTSGHPHPRPPQPN